MQGEQPSRSDVTGEVSKTFYWIAGALILLAGGLIRCFRIGDQIVLDDEWHALNVVQNTGYAFIFSHLGHADHSIPLALFYEWLSHSFGLDEITMRLPSLIAGIGVIVIFPLLMRPWLCRYERLVTAALLAISPFLINFSRVARPYSMITLLTACSLPLAWRWWKNSRGGSGVAWFMCTVLAAWLNPISLTISLAPFLWFGAEAIITGAKGNGWRPLFRLISIGMAAGVAVAALFYLPLTTDFISLTIKSGMDRTNPETWAVLLALFSGSGHDLVALAMTLAALAGLVILSMRAGMFGAWLAFVALVSGMAVAMTGAQWINYGLVPARYLSGLLPVFLALVSIALVSAGRRLQKVSHHSTIALHGFTLVVLLVLVTTGPLLSWDMLHSQFVHHLANQFDFKPSRNAILKAHESLQFEPFYAEIAKLHPRRDAVIIEAPWYLESNFNPLYASQKIHGQHLLIGFVGGLCAGRLYGELRPEVSGLKFRNFVWLTDLLEGNVSADYLVLRRAGIEGARPIEMEFGVCEKAMRDRFGAPWRTTENALVFKLESGN